jgi:hypothetical protein
MENLEMVVTSLESKIEKLIHLHRKSQEEAMRLAEQNKKLINSIEQQQLRINELDEKNKIIKLASSLSGDGSGEKMSDVKLKINELVREIDKCVSLLNK